MVRQEKCHNTQKKRPINFTPGSVPTAHRSNRLDHSDGLC